MSFISAYHMCAGEAAVADLAFTAKHAGLVEMSEMLPARRARGPNEPGGLSFGHMADIVQTSRKFRDDPCKIALETCAAASMLYDQIWLGGYMSGGVGFTMYATAAYTNNIVDDDLYAATEYGWDKYKLAVGKNVAQALMSLETSVPGVHSMVWNCTRTIQQLWKITSVVHREQLLYQQHLQLQCQSQQVTPMPVCQPGICPCTSTKRHTVDSVSSAMTCRISAVQPTCSPISPMKVCSVNSEEQTIPTMP
jgi:hypothetical protein